MSKPNRIAKRFRYAEQADTHPCAIGVPRKTHASSRPKPYLRGWDVPVSKHDTAGGQHLMVATDLRPPVMRDFTGAKTDAPTGDADAMRANVARSWLHVTSAHPTVKVEPKGKHVGITSAKQLAAQLRSQQVAAARSRKAAAAKAQKGASK